MFDDQPKLPLMIGGAVLLIFFVALLFSAGILAGLVWTVILAVALGMLIRQNHRVATGTDILRNPGAIGLGSGSGSIAQTLGMSDRPKPAPASTPATAPARESGGQTHTDDASRPPSLGGPRDGTPDDLTRITGIDTKTQESLNSSGYYHYDQIAGWSPANVAWADTSIDGVSGGASRDDWVGQAKGLSGGTAQG